VTKRVLDSQLEQLAAELLIPRDRVSQRQAARFLFFSCEKYFKSQASSFFPNSKLAYEILGLRAVHEKDLNEKGVNLQCVKLFARLTISKHYGRQGSATELTYLIGKKVD
jgi:hypothetical protein